MIKIKLFIITIMLLMSLPSISQPPTISFDILNPLISGISQGVDIVNSGDGSGRLFVAQRAGLVKAFSSTGSLLNAAFIDVNSLITAGGATDERGLFSIVFDPNYETNGYIYLYYTIADPDNFLVIARFYKPNPMDNTSIDISTRVNVIEIPRNTGSTHYGGKLNFGSDGNLYLSVGEGGDGSLPPFTGQAQSITSLWGKMIRINVSTLPYTIPSNNPYANSTTVRKEIIAMGLRNPWRWSFDKLNGNMWIGDVGEGKWEEVHYISSTSLLNTGVNYGWPCYEGNDFTTWTPPSYCPPSTHNNPVVVYPWGAGEPNGGRSITGGYVYRGSLYSNLCGYYICADFLTPNVFLTKPNGSGWTTTVQNNSTLNPIPTGIVGFGESEDGNKLYAISYFSGKVFEVSASGGVSACGIVPLSLLQFGGNTFNGYNELKWKTTNEQNLSHYDIEHSDNSTTYMNIGRVNANNILSENNYTFRHNNNFTKSFYRLKIVDKDGKYSYSNVIFLDKKQEVRIYPTLVLDNITIASTDIMERVSIYTTDGRLAFTKTLNSSGTINIPLPKLITGFYMVNVKTNNTFINQKIFIK